MHRSNLGKDKLANTRPSHRFWGAAQNSRDRQAKSGKRHAVAGAENLASAATARHTAVDVTVADSNESRREIHHAVGHKKSRLMGSICGISDFVRRMKMQARFGSLSRAPLQLLRFELRGAVAQCDWLARPPDKWDAGLPKGVGERNASEQAIADALAVRDLLLKALPEIENAALHIYRRLQGDLLELIVRGNVSRAEAPPTAVRSLAMRAKLCGFQFWLDDGILEPLQIEEQAVNA